MAAAPLGPGPGDGIRFNEGLGFVREGVVRNAYPIKIASTNTGATTVKEVGDTQTFGRNLRAAVPGLRMTRPRCEDTGKQVRTYNGVKIG